jgi:hypothetical protein
MPHDVITLHDDVIEKQTHGGHDIIVRNQYEAPAGPNSELADDPFKRMDLANAKWMMDILLKEYPGHLWRTVYDGAQKMAYVSIPVLMGINKFWAINLVTDPLTEGLLIRCAGELLERYGLPRGRFELTPFLEAREKHSALIVPKRQVPE